MFIWLEMNGLIFCSADTTGLRSGTDGFQRTLEPPHLSQWLVWDHACAVAVCYSNLYWVCPIVDGSRLELESGWVPKKLVVYKTPEGKEPFRNWLLSLRDKSTRVRITRRLEHLEKGHYGDFKAVGDGVLELRLFFGSGYRIYMAEDGETLIILLTGEQPIQRY